ncbi:MAG: glycoside hydrolase family 9 protein [Betaproteobacteria bacterium]
MNIKKLSLFPRLNRFNVAILILAFSPIVLSACLPDIKESKKQVARLINQRDSSSTPKLDETYQPKDIDRLFIKAGEPQIGLVAPTILAVPILDGRVMHGIQEAYVAKTLDYVSTKEGGSTHWLIRNAEKVGALVGPNRSTLIHFDQVADRLPNRDWLDTPGSYEVTSPTDAAFAKPRAPSQVDRKTRPIDLAETAPDTYSPPPQLHTVYLRFDTPFREGQEYRVRIHGGKLPDQVFRFNSEQTRSEALHVNTLGFHPADGKKIGFLSAWLGSGGSLSFPADQAFKVVVDGTGESVFEGKASLSLSATLGEDHQYRNFSGTDVYLLDFSSFKRVGRFRLVVPGVGCSHSFVISPDVWSRAFATNTKGLYHQRSGIAHEGIFSSLRRPRDLHPADGVRIYQSSCSLMDSRNGLNISGEKDNFTCLTQGRSPTLVPEAWGGYHDAGDWDRRIQHLDASRNLIELYELFPETMHTVVLDIPESGNALPDVLDEVMWSMDVFRRLQTADGGIRGGIESSDNPHPGESSWTESNMLMVYAPDMWSSYLYAADAARLSMLLKPLDAKLSADYEASALKAVNYAENSFKQQGGRPLPYQVNDARNLSAAALYKLTGLKEWHQIYQQTNRISDGELRLHKTPQREDKSGWNQQSAAFLYLTIKNRPLDPNVKDNLLKAFTKVANDALKRISRTGFRWLKESDDEWVGWGTLGASQAGVLLRANYLTGDKRYLDAAIEASQFALGANPLNMSFTTGLGSNTARRLWVIDARVTGQEAPEGITAYGPIDPVHLKDNWNFNKSFAPYVYPKASNWPANENYFDVYAIYPMNEFTISETIAPNIYVWGYLSAVYPALNSGK